MRLGFFVALRALTIFAAGIQISAIGICQTGNTVVGSGYSPPVPIPATRGQLLTIYVQGLGVGVTGRRQAESLPLPTSLAGISVSLEQAIVPNGPFAVPLLAVFPVNSCPDRSGPCDTLTGINLQIPYELASVGPIRRGRYLDKLGEADCVRERNHRGGGRSQSFFRSASCVAVWGQPHGQPQHSHCRRRTATGKPSRYACRWIARYRKLPCTSRR